MWCIVLQCVAACCSVLAAQFDGIVNTGLVVRSVLQYAAARCRMDFLALQCLAVCCNMSLNHKYHTHAHTFK